MERDARHRNAQDLGTTSTEPTPGKRTLTEAVRPRAARDNELAPIVVPRAPEPSPRKRDEAAEAAEAAEALEAEELQTEEPARVEAPAPARENLPKLPRLDLGRSKP